MAQNPEMMERTCANLQRMADEQGWRDLSVEMTAYAGDYDQTDRSGAPDWRLDLICDGHFAWAIALYGDVAPFVLMPTNDPQVFVDFSDNRWAFALASDGRVDSLSWTIASLPDDAITLLPMDNFGSQAPVPGDSDAQADPSGKGE